MNWKIVESPSYQLQEGDLISARKIGRMKLASIGEQTRKNKWRITLEFFQNKFNRLAGKFSQTVEK